MIHRFSPIRFRKTRLFSTKFDADTKLIQVDDHLYRGMVTQDWSIANAPNGGYLMSLALLAAQSSSPFKHPLVISVQYMRKSDENTETDFEVQILNTTKTTANIQVSLLQNQKLRCRFLTTFSEIKPSKFNMKTISSPDFPPLEECVDGNKFLRRFGDKLRIANQLDIRFHPDCPFAKQMLKGEIGENALLDAYVKFEDNRLPSLTSIPLFCDALPPPILNVFPVDWVPTVDYSVYFKSQNIHTLTSPWIRARFHTNYVENGILSTDGELWSEDGSLLLAKSRQLARLLSR